MSDYCYSLSDEIYEGSFESREDAFDAGVEEAKNKGLSGTFTVYTGVAVKPQLRFESMAKSVLDDAVQQADESDPDDYSEDWPANFDIDGLAKTISDWFAKKKIELPYFIVSQVEEHQAEVTDHED